MQPIRDESGQEAGQVTRRRVLFAGAGTAAGVAVLAACGGNGGGTSPGGSGGSASGSGGGGGGGALVKASAVPVGGGVSVNADGKPLIVSQPSEGQIVAFSAVCTHMGCTVAPEGKQIVCPCHGSVYSLATGDNISGPAPRPLAKVPVKVSGGEVVQS